MSVEVKAFRAIRPASAYAEQVAALPYDVMNEQEARDMTKDAPYSFLHIDRAEVDLPEGTDPHSDAVYAKAAQTYREMKEKGIFIEDETTCMYIYRLTMEDRSQSGIVACASVDDYIEGRIKKHELTRADKEEDRIRHVAALNANTGPIFLAYRTDAVLEKIKERIMEETSPEASFTADGGVKHEIWKISKASDAESIEGIFNAVDSLYIADGHHRCASAAKVAIMKREQNPGYTGEEEFNRFLAVMFPSAQLKILDYNRVVSDLAEMTPEELIEKAAEKFDIEELPARQCPPQRHSFTMYVADKWYKLTAKEGTYDEKDPVASLDVSILQENLLAPVLGIKDPRTDKRIDFVGGIRGIKSLEDRVDAGRAAAAFAMHPTSMNELMKVADEGKIMPPKSTWFEPKLLSGLFIHELD